ncbi:MAG: hypothetical protein OXB84_00275 [Halobacteriovoraceae bacterium]|nr:hypothetical protein [Halobacteriovoraceae bacterium]
MREKQISFSAKELNEFRNWINLNMDGLTWQGRYTQDFEDFWKFFFFEGVGLAQITERLQFARENCKVGPLSAWFNWLQEKIISFTFIKKQVDICRIAQETKINISDVASMLRDFFMSAFPHLDEYLADVFQVGNMASENLHISFMDISGKTGLMDNIAGPDDGIMKSMEVTLYEEWNDLNRQMRRVFGEGFNLKALKRKTSIKKQAKFLQEIFILLVLGIIVIYGVHSFNKWYELHLADKISIYGPQFKWPEKKLKFKNPEQKNVVEVALDLDIKPDLKQIEEEQKIEQQEQQKNFEQDLFEVESEVMITSWDVLPRDFDTVSQEQSEYEELRKGGYRDSRFGNKTVYRVMMRSASPFQSRSELNSLLDRYEITQVDNVRPGLYVPGGVYYNLLVPGHYVKEFLAQVMDVDDAILYESRTRRPNPPGMTKVFVWIKSI